MLKTFFSRQKQEKVFTLTKRLFYFCKLVELQTYKYKRHPITNPENIACSYY